MLLQKMILFHIEQVLKHLNNLDAICKAMKPNQFYN